MKILLSTPLEDQKTGLYLLNSLRRMNNSTACYDHRVIEQALGKDEVNEKLIRECVENKPEIVIVCKGECYYPETIKKLKELGIKIVFWNYDVTTLGDAIPISKKYVEIIKEADIFYTPIKDYIEPLKTVGVNGMVLQTAAFQDMTGEIPTTWEEEKRYGAPVVFIGNVGSNQFHPQRLKLLMRIIDEGFPLKIYGDFFNIDKIPTEIKERHQQLSVINEFFAIVCQSSKIILGMDAYPELDGAFSQRLFKVTSAGGFYLTTHTKGIEKFFEVGKEIETYKNENELIEKLSYYLTETNDSKRKEIAEAGMQRTIKEHQWTHRFEKMFEDLKNLKSM